MSDRTPHFDDGTEYLRPLEKSPERVTNRKARQLAAQAADAVRAALAASADPVLRDLVVLDAVPAPHAGRLLVRLARGPAADPATTDADVGERLARATGWLRTEVAAAVHRRRAPELALVLVT
jgi:ribosome-binding factor A